MRHPVLAIIAFFMSLALIACGGTPAGGAGATGLVGTWQAVDKDGHYTFRADGSGELRLGTLERSFTWKTEDETLLLLLQEDSGTRGVEASHAISPEGHLDIWTSDDPDQKTRFTRQ